MNWWHIFSTTISFYSWNQQGVWNVRHWFSLWCRSYQKVIFCVSSLWHAIFCFLCHVSFLHQIVIDFKWSISHAIVQQIVIDLWTFHILFSKYVTWCKSMIIQWSTLLLKSFHIPILLIPVVKNLNTFAYECRYA